MALMLMLYLGRECMQWLASAVTDQKRSTDSTTLSNQANTEALADKTDLLRRRRRVMSTALSVSYANRDPLYIVGGDGAFLIDDAGRRFLDTRNNVAHVGHTHAAVVAAVSNQVARINTNTRYLHHNAIMLAERLLATFPSPLGDDGVVFFVNSGSEANDLALRLAYTYTRATEVVVVDRAYHGHTLGTIAISPYKFAHRRYPHTSPPHTHVVPAPDCFRGKYTGPNAADQYASEVEDVCQQLHGNLAAFFMESGMSVAGVILPPKEYVSRCYRAARRAGAVCVADEVQTGLGRCGDTWWMFEQTGQAPDIVTVGKPFGNGMPLAAVVCRRTISESFAQGPEYFNTFGGNPVACAAGLAVLDVIEREQLMANASLVGRMLMEQMDHLSRRHSLIGNVRGRGLFIGVELVHQGSPATQHAAWICSRLVHRHKVLTSLDGPHDNVLVIKPPLCFSVSNVNTFIRAFDECLTAASSPAATAEISSMGHTPT